MEKLRTEGDAVDYRDVVEQALSEAAKEKSWVSSAAVEALRAGGKRIRPIIALLVCESISGSHLEAIPVALAYELAHSASLVQDDIIDESSMRHSAPATHKKHGITKAILISDVLIFEIFSQLARYKTLKLSKSRLIQLLDLVARAAKGAAEGEYLEAKFASRGNITQEECTKVASLKTGALFAGAAASGAVVAGAGKRVVGRMHQFGTDLGVAFQIRDDILDFTGESVNTGKPIFRDMSNNACNTVIAHALSTADPYKRNRINSMLYKKWFAPSETKRLLSLLKELGSLDFAVSLAAEYSRRCTNLISTLPESEARRALERIIQTVGHRSE